MRRFVRWVVGTVAFIVSTAPVAAQDLSRPVGVRFAKDDWTFVPVVKSVAGVWSVPGILALRRKDNVVGQNIVSIWYEFPAAAGGAWLATSWASQDHWQAIAYTKNRFDISNDFDFMWPTSDPVAAPLDPETPAPYFHGLFEVDPLAGLPVDENRDQVISVLTGLGYQSASVTVEQVGPCEGESVLDALAATAVLAVSTPTPAWSLEESFSSGIPDSCAAIDIVPPPAGLIPGTDLPLPGIPLGPWKRDSRPAVLRSECMPSFDCCYAAPIVFRYVRKGAFGLEYIEYCEGQLTWQCPGEPGVLCPAQPSCPGPELPSPDPASGPVTCGHPIF